MAYWLYTPPSQHTHVNSVTLAERAMPEAHGGAQTGRTKATRFIFTPKQTPACSQVWSLSADAGGSPSVVHAHVFDP